MRVNVETSGLKVGDVLEGDGRFYVVTSTYTNSSGMPEAAVLCTDGRSSAFTDATGSVSGFQVRIWCFKCALRCLMNAWKIPFVTGIRTSGQNLKVRSSRRLKHPDFYALLSNWP
jgi:hypothetical protein